MVYPHVSFLVLISCLVDFMQIARCVSQWVKLLLLRSASLRQPGKLERHSCYLSCCSAPEAELYYDNKLFMFFYWFRWHE